FNLDPIRIPQKYPGKKHFKGPNKGQPSANPLGKNPGDFWYDAEGRDENLEMPNVWIIPNVKHNHVEKTIHPCQFPVELVERLVLALSNPGDLVVDPYMGVGSSACVKRALEGELRRRPLGRPIYQPSPNDRIARRPEGF